MAKRSGFTTDDLDVLDSTLEAQIAVIVDGDDNSQMPALAKIQKSAPLFRVREKVIAMKNKADSSPKSAKPKQTRGPRPVVQPAGAGE